VSLAAHKAIHTFGFGRNSGFATHLIWKIRARLKEAAGKHVRHNGLLGLSAPGPENDDGEQGDSAVDCLHEGPWTECSSETEQDETYYDHLLTPLGDLEREVVRMIERYGMTQEEVGAYYGKSRTWAANICNSAIRKMRLFHANVRVTVLGAVVEGNVVCGPGYLPIFGGNRAGRDFLFQYRQALYQGIGVLRQQPRHHIIDMRIGLGLARKLPSLPYVEPKLGGELRYSPLTKDEIAAKARYVDLHEIRLTNLVWRNKVGVEDGERWYRTTTKCFEPAETINLVLLAIIKPQLVEPARPGGYRIDVCDPVEPRPRWICAPSELTEMFRYGRTDKDEVLFDGAETLADERRLEKEALSGDAAEEESPRKEDKPVEWQPLAGRHQRVNPVCLCSCGVRPQQHQTGTENSNPRARHSNVVSAAIAVRRPLLAQSRHRGRR
jgi:hypothetical protein